MLKTFHEGADDDIHSRDDTAASRNHGLGLSGIAVDLRRRSGTQELQTSLELTQVGVELFLEAERARFREQGRLNVALVSRFT